MEKKECWNHVVPQLLKAEWGTWGCQVWSFPCGDISVWEIFLPRSKEDSADAVCGPMVYFRKQTKLKGILKI